VSKPAKNKRVMSVITGLEAGKITLRKGGHPIGEGLGADIYELKELLHKDNNPI
jgi:hypothetical protein